MLFTGLIRFLLSLIWVIVDTACLAQTGWSNEGFRCNGCLCRILAAGPSELGKVFVQRHCQDPPNTHREHKSMWHELCIPCAPLRNCELRLLRSVPVCSRSQVLKSPGRMISQRDRWFGCPCFQKWMCCTWKELILQHSIPHPWPQALGLWYWPRQGHCGSLGGPQRCGYHTWNSEEAFLRNVCEFPWVQWDQPSPPKFLGTHSFLTGEEVQE